MAFGRHVWFWATRSIRALVLAVSLFLTPSFAFTQGSPDIVWATAGYRAVYSVAYSPDGKAIASAGYCYQPNSEPVNAARLWFDGGRRVETLATHRQYLQRAVVAFSADGQLVAARYGNGLGIWRVSDRARVHAFAGLSPSRIAFSPDGSWMAASGGSTVSIWRLSDWGLERTITTQAEVNSIAFSVDGRLLAVATQDTGFVTIFDTETGAATVTLRGAVGPVYSVVFGPDGHLVVGGGADGKVRVWRAYDGALLTTMSGHTAPIRTVAISADGRTVASAGSDSTVRLWEAGGSPLHVLAGHEGAANGVSFSPDSQRLLSCGDDGAILEWSVQDGRLLRELTAHRNKLPALAFSPDGTVVASGGADSRIVLWGAADGERRSTLLANGECRSLRFSPDGEMLLAGSGSNILGWDLTTGQLVRSFVGHTGVVDSIALTPDGSMLASAARDRSIRLWRVSDATPLGVLEGVFDYSTTVEFSPDGTLLASGVTGGRIGLWRVPDLSPVASIGENIRPVGAIFTPDGEAILGDTGSGYGASLQLWSVADGSLVRQFTGWGLVSGDSVVRNAAFSPDGRFLVSTDRYALRIWSVAAGARVRMYWQDTDGGGAVAYSPDGERIAYACDDMTLRVASMPPDSVSSFCTVRVAGWLGSSTELGSRPVDVRVGGEPPIGGGRVLSLGDNIYLWLVLQYTGTHRVWARPGGFLAQAIVATTNGLGPTLGFIGPRGQGLLPGDTNDDNRIDDADLAAVLREFGGPPTGAHGWTDTNGDRMVDIADLNNVLLSFGLDGDDP